MFLALADMVANVRSDGPEEGPALVFVNALGSDLRIWDDVVPHLSAAHRCIRYDKRGHGLSEDAEPYDLDAQTADLFDVLDALEIYKATVVGISVGGLIALSAALTRPERVHGLALCDTAARIGSADGWDERIEWVEAEGLERTAAAIVERWFAPDFGSRRLTDLRGYTTMLARTSDRAYLGTCALLRDSDLRERVGSIRCPTLVLTGADDLATPPERGRELAERIPEGRFAEIEGAGHLPCIETPHELSRLVRGFLEDVGHG